MWLNGFFVPDDTPFLKISDQGANGVGLFETVYAEKGEIFFLEDHLERFSRAWDHILGNSFFENESRNASYPDVPFIWPAVKRPETSLVSRVGLSCKGLM